MGLAGALVGAAVSTGAVVWQQRRTAHEAERAYLLGLGEAAANEVIRLSYEIEDLFDNGAILTEGDGRERLRQKYQAVEAQSLRFADAEVQAFMAHCNSELFVVANGTGAVEQAGHYIRMCVAIRHVMGSVLRRQPIPGRFRQRGSARS